MEGHLLSLIKKLQRMSLIEVSILTLVVEMGLQQGSVFSILLFNIYLEEAPKTSQKLEQVRKRGDLLAFEDDIILISNSKHEI